MRKKPSPPIPVDIILIGGSLVGLSAACYLAKEGLQVAVVEARSPEAILSANNDSRSSAISSGSAEILNQSGIWKKMLPEAGPIVDIRVTDGDSRLFLHYGRELVEGEPMGYMVENQRMLEALFSTANKLKNLTLYSPSSYTTIETTPGHVKVTLDNGIALKAPLLIGADGRNSAIRAKAGIGTTEWPYHQVGIVCTIGHETHHQHIAQERFLPAGPFAVLPLKDGHHSSLVWTEYEDTAPLYMKMPESEFLAQIDQRIGGYLGTLSLKSKRFAYPLTLCHAKAYTAPRMALIGDAAHAIHPIAGQGFNLGIRDIGVLVPLITKHHRLGLDIGSALLLEEYEQLRRPDNSLMIAVTDGLNHLFSNNITPLAHARRMGMAAVNALPPLKRFFMRHAMGK